MRRYESPTNVEPDMILSIYIYIYIYSLLFDKFPNISFLQSKSPLKKANQTTNNEKSDLVQRSTASSKNGSRKLADGTTQSKSTSAANHKAKTVSSETRRPNQPLPEIPYQQDHESSAKSSLRMGRVSSQMSSNNYEILQTTNSSSPTASGLSNPRYLDNLNMIFI